MFAQLISRRACRLRSIRFANGLALMETPCTLTSRFAYCSRSLSVQVNLWMFAQLISRRACRLRSIRFANGLALGSRFAYRSRSPSCFRPTSWPFSLRGSLPYKLTHGSRYGRCHIFSAQNADVRRCGSVCKLW